MPGTRLFFIGSLAIALAGTMLLVAATMPSTPSETVPRAVAAGYRIWRRQNCEGCHSIYGQGGSYAPDLTHIVEARGDTYLREFMVNPNAFHPGERLMPRFNLTVGETTGLVAFLEWVGSRKPADSWPPRPLQVAGMGIIGDVLLSRRDDPELVSDDPGVMRGRQLFSTRCASCHSLEPGVDITGPSLAGIADRAWQRIPGVGPEAYIRASILYPSNYIVAGYADLMQKNFGEQLSSQDIDDLIAFLMTLEESSR